MGVELFLHNHTVYEKAIQLLADTRRAAGQESSGNIIFCTCAKLYMIEPEEIEDIEPAYSILDGFHRCGAAELGDGVNALIETYPEAGVLDLSATHIRYLDNQRDMAEELFEGSVVGEMSLGETIARNILPAPKYVISLYSCQKISTVTAGGCSASTAQYRMPPRNIWTPCAECRTVLMVLM